jgi:outer membrane protein TolC
MEGNAPFDPEDGLTLEEGRLVALAFNPRLRIARLRLDRAQVTALHSGVGEDPDLSLSLLRITEATSDPWIINPGLTFTIPLSGRLGAERSHAAASQRAAERRALEAEWDVSHDVRKAWAEWTAARLRVEETERLLASMETLVETASRLAETGEIQRTEASLFTVDEARRRNRLLGLQGEERAAEQRLRSHLGLAPEAPVTFLPFLEATRPVTATGDEISARNPGLARLRLEYEVAEEGLRREIRKQIPDLHLGPQYESDEGQSRVGFLGGIPIPLLNANRKAIAEARVDRELARAAFETEYELLVGRWAAATAGVRALTEQRREMEEVLVPLIDRQLQDALELLRLGEGKSLVLLESLTRAHEIKLELLEIRLRESLALAELDHLIGPQPPERPFATTEDTP